jgi:hypothetical protein
MLKVTIQKLIMGLEQCWCRVFKTSTGLKVLIAVGVIYAGFAGF